MLAKLSGTSAWCSELDGLVLSGQKNFFISQQQGNKMSDMHKYNENS